MDTHPLGRRGLRQGLIMGMLGSRWRPDTESERIDVRRGDRPYERLVADTSRRAEPSDQTSDEDRRPDDSSADG